MLMVAAAMETEKTKTTVKMTTKITAKTMVKDDDDMKTMVKMTGMDDDSRKGWLVPSARYIF